MGYLSNYRGAIMLIDARWQQHLIATLHLGPPDKSEHLDGVVGSDRGRSNDHTIMRRPTECNVDDSTRLVALLEGLGVGSDVVGASIKRNGADVARAAAIIAEWMTYLPENCVKAMVRDSWHWST
jgi:hypothetical protein